jgi:hypothetical protein
MNRQEARRQWEIDKAQHEANGIYLPDVKSYLPDEFRRDFQLAMDTMPELLAMDQLPAFQPQLTTAPNSAVPALLTTLIDPEVFKILFAPNRAATIFGEVRKGNWLDETAMFPVVEHTGEVSSYGDFSENGRAGVNTNWPQRQSYLFQCIKEWGERELERAGLARINWVSEVDTAAATVLAKFSNYTYFFGVQSLQNYGLLNDPNLTPAITPSPKAATGTPNWITAGAVTATANEVYADIQSMFYQLQLQCNGLVDADSQMTLAMHPGTEVALTATNQYNVNVFDILRKNFPNIRFETAVQYGAITPQNPQGLAVGNMVQLIIDDLEGQDTGYCSYNEKMRSHPLIRAMSSFRQKVSAGTWGAIIRMPVGIVQMVGV